MIKFLSFILYFLNLLLLLKIIPAALLTFSSADVDSVIQFSDRPFKQTGTISIDNFIDLFSIVGNNSFSVDPPNGVLVSSEEQKTYELKTASGPDSNGKYKIELELIDGEIHSNVNKVIGKFSLFVDSSSVNAATAIYKNKEMALLNEMLNKPFETYTPLKS